MTINEDTIFSRDHWDVGIPLSHFFGRSPSHLAAPRFSVGCHCGLLTHSFGCPRFEPEYILKDCSVIGRNHEINDFECDSRQRRDVIRTLARRVTSRTWPPVTSNRYLERAFGPKSLTN
jgi:hypothetical protein